MKRVRSALLWSLLLVCGLFLATRAMEGQEDAEKMVGKPAPTFSLNLVDGGKMNLADHKGKDIVVLDFWATWCPPCRMVMPKVVQLMDKYKSKGVVFYAVDLSESADKVKAYQQATGLKFTCALDSDAGVASDYAVDGIPMDVIIGKDGVIQAVHIGASPDLIDKMTKELDTLVAGKSLVAPAKPKTESKPEVKK